MKVIINPEESSWQNLSQRPQKNFEDIQNTVSEILKRVQKEGDLALKAITKEIHHLDLIDFKVSASIIEKSVRLVPNRLKEAIFQASQNIQKFHEAQRENFVPMETMPGVTCWRKSLPIEQIGIYIPGGTAPLFSTVLMLGIPAKIAGCKNIILCTPPNEKGEVHPAILFAAKLIGIDQIFLLGGAQAIAAMAYGTESVPKVLKIFGPGNSYVMLAKQYVLQDGVAIDMPAGPSEVAVIADDQANPAFVASDLLSQAEHGPDSQVMLICESVGFVEKVKDEIALQLLQLNRSLIAEEALNNSSAIVLSSSDDRIAFSNVYCPEHLIIQTEDYEELASKVSNAGSVFLGPYTPESAGDYASGTNHTLPTNGYASVYAGVSLDSFVKKVTFQKITKEGLKNLGSIVECMAEGETLMAHKNAVSIRLKD